MQKDIPLRKSTIKTTKDIKNFVHGVNTETQPRNRFSQTMKSISPVKTYQNPYIKKTI